MISEGGSKVFFFLPPPPPPPRITSFVSWVVALVPPYNESPG